MKQVPHYLLIGNGRVATHFKHYLSLLALSFDHWHRQESLDQLVEKQERASHILLLIHDDAIESFYTTHLKNTSATCIHFSGSLVSDLVFGAHPLMSFTQTLYTIEHYQSIPFIVDHDAPHFKNLLPGLLNQHVRLDKSKKIKYHALCVMSGNFSCMLWQKLFMSLKHEFNIDEKLALPYLFQQTQNLYHHYESALTGPLVREDLHTIKKHIHALCEDPFKEVYQSFVACYQRLKENF